MKTGMRTATVTLLLSVSLCAMSYSQPAVDDFSAYLGVGTGLPQTPDYFKDNWDFGLSGSFAAALGIPGSEGLYAVGKAQYHFFPDGYENQIAPDFSNQGIDQKILLLGIDGMLVLGEAQRRVQPYFGIGMGVANIAFSNTSVNDSVTVSLTGETNIYANGFFGIDVDVTPALGIFGQVGYVWINTDEDATALVPIFVGVRL